MRAAVGVTTQREWSDLVAEAVRRAPGPAAEVFTQLCWSIVDADHLVEYLHRCAAVAAAHVPTASGAAVRVRIGPTTSTVAATDDTARAMVDSEAPGAGGPCASVMDDGQVLRHTADSLAAQWPAVAGRLAGGGVSDLLFLSVAAGTSCCGSFALYARAPLTDTDELLTELVCRLAERALGDYARLDDARRLVAQLRTAIAHRAPIEQAKGILMAEHRTTAEAAFAMLVTTSQHTNVRVHEVALQLVGERTAPALSTGG